MPPSDLELASTLPPPNSPAWTDSAVFRAAVAPPPPRWPKACSCGALHSALDWEALPFGYRWSIDADLLESRRCGCGSHISILVDDEGEAR